MHLSPYADTPGQGEGQQRKTINKDNPQIGIFGTRYTPKDLKRHKETGRVKSTIYLTTDIVDPDAILEEKEEPIIVMIHGRLRVRKFFSIRDHEAEIKNVLLSLVATDGH